MFMVVVVKSDNFAEHVKENRLSNCAVSHPFPCTMVHRGELGAAIIGHLLQDHGEP